MGLLSFNAAQTAMLTQQANNLQMSINQKEDARAGILQESTNLGNLKANYTTDLNDTSTYIEQIDQRLATLNALDSQLEAQINNERMKLQIVEQRKQTYQSKLDESISNTFR